MSGRAQGRAGMRLKVISVGRDKDWTGQGVADYAGRLSHVAALELVELPAERGPHAASIEGEGILAAHGKLKAPSELWALDLGGRELSSVELAQKVGRLKDASIGLSLAIGGDEGLSPAVREQARFVWSLGRLTLPHRLARLVVLEQVYRSFEILRGGPYHK
ncbi:MAG: 23S rRNA (pseudouridine(1915)-N(3))-methyltransferase RlmH [Deltaproteobacteria bacterium]|nr:23S rRNA (pseudouridine(1915)-N(3))-methyltransferase RlmH [Deltaproteobacteria bacterium]